MIATCHYLEVIAQKKLLENFLTLFELIIRNLSLPGHRFRTERESEVFTIGRVCLSSDLRSREWLLIPFHRPLAGSLSQFQFPYMPTSFRVLMLFQNQLRVNTKGTALSVKEWVYWHPLRYHFCDFFVYIGSLCVVPNYVPTLLTATLQIIPPVEFGLDKYSFLISHHMVRELYIFEENVLVE